MQIYEQRKKFLLIFALQLTLWVNNDLHTSSIITFTLKQSKGGSLYVGHIYNF